MSAWEDKCHKTEHSPPFLSLPSSFYCQSWQHLEYLFGHLGSSLPLPTPSTPSWWAGVRNRKTLTLCKPCLSTAKISLRYQRNFQHKTQTQPQLLWWTSPQPKAAQPIPCAQVQTQPTALWWHSTGATGRDGAASPLLVAQAFTPSLQLIFVSLSLGLSLQPHYKSRALDTF